MVWVFWLIGVVSFFSCVLCVICIMIYLEIRRSTRVRQEIIRSYLLYYHDNQFSTVTAKRPIMNIPTAAVVTSASAQSQAQPQSEIGTPESASEA